MKCEREIRWFIKENKGRHLAVCSSGRAEMRFILTLTRHGVYYTCGVQSAHERVLSLPLLLPDDRPSRAEEKTLLLYTSAVVRFGCMYISHWHGPRQIKSTARRTNTARESIAFLSFGRFPYAVDDGTFLLSFFKASDFFLSFFSDTCRTFPAAPPIKGHVRTADRHQLFVSTARTSRQRRISSISSSWNEQPSQTSFFFFSCGQNP